MRLRMRRLHVGLTALVCAWGAPSAPAHAQPSVSPPASVQRVAVVRMSYEGDVPRGHQDVFEARLVEGLAVAAFQVLAGAPVERKLSAAKLARCEDADCFPKVAEALDVGYLLVGRVEESNKNYDVTLDLINGRTGATLGKAHERCETCGMAEAAERVALTSAALRKRLEALAATPAHVVVRSQPAGARATVDGKPMGNTPVELELPGGQHRLVLELEGYNKTERSFTVVSGVEERLDVQMLKPPGRFPHRALGWTALAGGVALVAAGVYSATIDGKIIACAEDEKDLNGLCPRVRDTDALTAVLMGAGAAGLTLGGVWLWIASQQAPAEASSGASAHTVGLRFSGRF